MAAPHSDSAAPITANHLPILQLLLCRHVLRAVHAAVDVQRRPGDEAVVLRRQERDGPRHILRIFAAFKVNTDKLCVKIDELVTSFSDSNLKLNEVIISNDKDQKEVLRKLDDINDVVQDMHKRVVRIDTRLYDHKCIKEE